MDWIPAEKQLPPDGAPIIARWPDGETAPGVLTDGDGVWEWQLQAARHDLPHSWRFASPARHTGAKLGMSLSPALPIALVGAAVLALVGFAPWALALIAAAIGLWSALSLLSVITDYIMARRGAWLALVAFLAVGLALAAGVLIILEGLI